MIDVIVGAPVIFTSMSIAIALLVWLIMQRKYGPELKRLRSEIAALEALSRSARSSSTSSTLLSIGTYDGTADDPPKSGGKHGVLG